MAKKKVEVEIFKLKAGKIKCCKDAALHIDIIKRYYFRCTCGKLYTEIYDTVEEALKEWNVLKRNK